MGKERDFQKKVKAYLNNMPRTYHFTKEALALRGIPDIIGCINGRFFALELKKSRSEARKTTGRIVLQRYTMLEISRAGGYAVFVYPENWQMVRKALRFLLDD